MKNIHPSNLAPRRESAYSAKTESKREQLRCDSEISVNQLYFKNQNYSWISIELSIHISFLIKPYISIGIWKSDPSNRSEPSRMLVVSVWVMEEYTTMMKVDGSTQN